MECVSLVWFSIEVSMAVRSEVSVSVVRERRRDFRIGEVRALRPRVGGQLLRMEIGRRELSLLCRMATFRNIIVDRELGVVRHHHETFLRFLGARYDASEKCAIPFSDEKKFLMSWRRVSHKRFSELIRGEKSSTSRSNFQN